MDIAMIRVKAIDWIKKYRYVLLVLVLGGVLMLLPSRAKTKEDAGIVKTVPETFRLEVTESQLEEILSQIKGVGEVDVLLSYSAGEQTIFHTNTKTTEGNSNKTQDCETVLITDSERREEALVTQVLAPEYMGAVIVCQGAKDASVRLAVSEAVSKATGLKMDQISVLLMK